MTKYEKTLASIGFVVITATTVFTLCLLCFMSKYSFPNAEDVLIAADYSDNSFFDAYLNFFVFADARYSSNLLYGLLPLLVKHNSFYSTFSCIGLLLFTLVISTAMKEYYNLSAVKCLAAGCIFSGIYFSQVDSLPHTLYWAASSIVFLWGWITFFLWLVSFMYLRRVDDIKRVVTFIMSLLLVFAACGFNEMLTVLILYTCACFFAVTFVGLLKDVKTELLFYILVSTASAIFQALSPSVHNRVDDRITQSQQEWLGHLSAFKFFLQNLSHIVEQIFPLLLLVALAIILSYKLSKTDRTKHLLLFAYSLMGYVVINAVFFSIAGFEKGYPVRIFSATSLFLLIACFNLLLWILSFLTSANARILALSCSVVVGVYGLFIEKSIVSRSLNDLNKNVLTNVTAQSEKRKFSLQHPKKFTGNYTKVVLNKIENAPSWLWHGPDLETNRKKAVWNSAYERFYGVNEVCVKDDSVSKFINL